VDLDRILDVIGRWSRRRRYRHTLPPPVAPVFTAGSGLLHKNRCPSCRLVRGSTLLCLQSGVQAVAGGNPILPRAHIDLPDHAHLQVLGRADVAVKEISACVRCQVVVREARSDVDRHRGIRHTVIERGGVGIAVKVNGLCCSNKSGRMIIRPWSGQEDSSSS